MGKTMNMTMLSERSYAKEYMAMNPEKKMAYSGPLHSVLVVDDELIVATELAYHLEMNGYAIAGIAGDGEDAITLACRTRPDVIIMDIDMPGETDGIAAAQRIRRNLKSRIIFTSGHRDDDPRVRKVLDEGRHSFVGKPYPKELLYAKIQEVL